VCLRHGSRGLSNRSVSCTKDEKRARVLSKPVMMEFDRILAKAETLVAERPMRTELTEAEISRCCSGWASAARPFMISRALAYQIPNA
jgi:hypothetical protein